MTSTSAAGASAWARASASAASGHAVSLTELEGQGLISGQLAQPTKTAMGLLQTWRKLFVVLGPGEAAGSLALYGFLPDAKAPESGRLKLVMELDKGCEVRPLGAKHSPGRRENCFMIVTAKTQAQFQAPSGPDRERWLTGLTLEFERAVDSTLHLQKSKLLRKGGMVKWHRPAAKGGSVDCKLWVTADGNALMLDVKPEQVEIESTNIEAVTAGNETDALRASSAYHFNCFVVTLKTAVHGFDSIDLEAPKQSMRDDWVSALEDHVSGASSPSHADSTKPLQHIASRRQIVIVAEEKSAPEAGPAAGNEKAHSRSTALSSHSAANESDEEEEEEDEAEAPVAAASGVGEFFKQKVKLGGGFPYARCISFALETILDDVKSPHNKLTPARPITPQECEETKAHARLALPFTPAELAAHAEKQAKSKRRSRSKPKHTRFDVTVYAPAVFKELRNRYGVSDPVFFSSLSALSGDGAVGDGKSGMLFFFTQDRKYVLKTVKPNEMTVLLDNGLLTAYLQHMGNNPDSLICRFFGLYKFKMGPKGNARDIYLVCMQNSFDTRLVVHEKYDLKGSTRNRWCTPRFGAVLKDLNFGNNKIYLDEKDRADFLAQCEKDTELLEKYNVMDYSLLLGIHKPNASTEEDVVKLKRNLLLLNMATKLEDKAQAKGATTSFANIRPVKTRWQRDFGGMEGRTPQEDRPQVYIMTIIDILQAYDLGKRAEHIIKAQIKDGKEEVSSVNPTAYRARFIAYLAKILVGVPSLRGHMEEGRVKLMRELADVRLALVENDGGGKAGKTRATSKPLPKLNEIQDVDEEDEDEEAPEALGASPRAAAPGKLSSPRHSSLTARASATAMNLRGIVSAIASAVSPTSSATRESMAMSLSDVVEPHTPTSSSPSTPGRDAHLKAEIAAAVESAEKAKRDVGTDIASAFVTILEDGTEITMLEDGGSIQRSAVDGTEIRTFPDGSMLQTNPDGSTISTGPDGKVRTEKLADGTTIVLGGSGGLVGSQTDADGIVIETYEDGSVVQRQPDGVTIRTAANGDTRQVFPDGTLITVVGGVKVQLDPSGVSVTTLLDGTRIQENASEPGITLTLRPDGTKEQSDGTTGTLIVTRPDGTEEHRFGDGTLIVRRPNGRVEQTAPDGAKTVIEEGKTE